MNQLLEKVLSTSSAVLAAHHTGWYFPLLQFQDLSEEEKTRILKMQTRCSVL